MYNASCEYDHIEWLKLNFASCVVHQTRSLDVLIPYFWMRLKNSGSFCVGQVPRTSNVTTRPKNHARDASVPRCRGLLQQAPTPVCSCCRMCRADTRSCSWTTLYSSFVLFFFPPCFLFFFSAGSPKKYQVRMLEEIVCCCWLEVGITFENAYDMICDILLKNK